MKPHLASILCAAFLFGCSSWTPQQISLADSIAKIAITSAANYYGGANAPALASAGLFGLAAVEQAYVGTKIPASIVTQSPGVADIGKQLVPLLTSSGVVTQAQVNSIHEAAVIVASSTAQP